MLRFVALGLCSRSQLAAENLFLRKQSPSGQLKTAVRSQFGFKLENVWNQRFTAVANSPIEPANRLRISDFGKIRNVVAQIFPRWNPLTSWMRQVEEFQRAA